MALQALVVDFCFVENCSRISERFLCEINRISVMAKIRNYWRQPNVQSQPYYTQRKEFRVCFLSLVVRLNILFVMLIIMMLMNTQLLSLANKGFSMLS